MQEKLQKLLDSTVDNKNIFGAVLKVDSPNDASTVSSGNMSSDKPFFIASTTKLFTSTMVFQLRFEGKLDLDEYIAKYLDTEIMEGLHIFKDRDYSDEITIRHLLSHTSGIADYFEQKDESGVVLLDEILSGRDRAWSFEEMVALSKRMSPKFAPGTPKKAFYSDTNYQLLGKVIEVVTGKSFDENLNGRILKPLNLTQTYMYRDSSDLSPAPIYFKKQALLIPKAMSSFGPDGGMVSTVDEMMIFLKAFYDGSLFPKAYIEEAKAWNRILFPLDYGIGMMRFKLPRIFTPFKAIPELIGHSGLSGSFAFYVPKKELFMVGTVNQTDNPGRSFKMMIKALDLFPNRS